jgi:polysaccharide biosynthesis/export protein
MDRYFIFFSDYMIKMIFIKNFSKTGIRISILPLIVILSVGIFSLTASPVGAQQQKPDNDNAVYEFGFGDVLEVLVFNEPEISKTVFVRNDGRISLPLIGEIMAAGTTSETLAKKISEKLMKVVAEPNVTVILTENNSKAYYILGQITHPGEYKIARPLTVLQAIARAGGFLEWAKKSRIMIVSGPKKSEKITYFNYDDFLGGDNIGQNVMINPEDTIVIP